MFARLVIIASMLLLTACSSTDQKTEEKIAAQPVTDSTGTPVDILSKGFDAFNNAPGLTQEEKTKLNQIHGRTFTESMKIRREIGQAKAALFDTLVDKKASKKEVAALRKKIVSLDQKRLDLMFSSLDQVQKIIGDKPDTMEFYRRNFLMEHRELSGRE